MSWLTEGPLIRAGGDSNMARGARLGSLGGPIGMGLGALGGWLMDRHDASQRAEMNQGLNTTLGNDIQQTQDRIWGDPSQPAPDNGGGTLPQFAMDPNATSMGPPVDEDGDGRVTPGERRDAAMGGYAAGGKFAGTPFNGSVSYFGSTPVFTGSGDPNSKYRNRGTDFGG